MIVVAYIFIIVVVFAVIIVVLAVVIIVVAVVIIILSLVFLMLMLMLMLTLINYIFLFRKPWEEGMEGFLNYRIGSVSLTLATLNSYLAYY